jgi:hypothetical protein
MARIDFFDKNGTIALCEDSVVPRRGEAIGFGVEVYRVESVTYRLMYAAADRALAKLLVSVELRGSEDW